MNKAYALIIGEEQRSKAKVFLMAPKFADVMVGETVIANSARFTVLYLDEYVQPDSEKETMMRVALGNPSKISEIVRSQVIDWRDDDDSDMDG